MAKKNEKYTRFIASPSDVLKNDMRISIQKNELEVIGNLQGVIHRRNKLLDDMEKNLNLKEADYINSSNMNVAFRETRSTTSNSPKRASGRSSWRFKNSRKTSRANKVS